MPPVFNGHYLKLRFVAVYLRHLYWWSSHRFTKKKNKKKVLPQGFNHHHQYYFLSILFSETVDFDYIPLLPSEGQKFNFIEKRSISCYTFLNINMKPKAYCPPKGNKGQKLKFIEKSSARCFSMYFLMLIMNSVIHPSMGKKMQKGQKLNLNNK